MRYMNRLRNEFKLLVIFVALFFGMAIVSSVQSVSAQTKKGNEGKGRFYFRQNCKSCHTKGQSGGEVTPLSKTMAQWMKYFEAGKHAKHTEALTKIMTDDELRYISTYLVAHAADSLQPETCGKN